MPEDGQRPASPAAAALSVKHTLPAGSSDAAGYHAQTAMTPSVTAVITQGQSVTDRGGSTHDRSRAPTDQRQATTDLASGVNLPPGGVIHDSVRQEDQMAAPSPPDDSWLAPVAERDTLGHDSNDECVPPCHNLLPPIT